MRLRPSARAGAILALGASILGACSHGAATREVVVMSNVRWVEVGRRVDWALRAVRV